ncbi:TolB-like protein [Rhizobium ruizarguesonis]
MMPSDLGAGIILGVVMVALAVSAYLLPIRLDSTSQGSIEEGPTLVVAPFANLGDGPQAALYTAGLTEELLTALPRFKEIRVFGRETSKSLPSGVEASQVRGELGARFLLAGQRDGERRRRGQRLHLVLSSRKGSAGGRAG